VCTAFTLTPDAVGSCANLVPLTWGRLIGDTIRHIWTLNDEELQPTCFASLYWRQRDQWPGPLEVYAQKQLQHLIKRQMAARRQHLSNDSDSDDARHDNPKLSTPPPTIADIN
jgi:hypothetical protein